MLNPLRLALLIASFAAGPALADLRITYVDSSPDRITVQNRSGCDLGQFELTIDLGRSPAGLIFDTSSGGAGFSASAPPRVLSGTDQVLGLAVTDGDNRLVLDIDFLAGGGTVVLAVDVDDTRADSALGRTMAAGSEIAGAAAEARLVSGGRPHTGLFQSDGVATVPLEACIS